MNINILEIQLASQLIFNRIFCNKNKVVTGW